MRPFKHSTVYLLVILLNICCYLQSCTFEKGDLPKPIIIQSATFQATVKPLLVTYCYGQGTQTCHVSPSNQGSNGNFTTYAGIKAKVDNGSLQTRVINLKTMPPPYSAGPSVIAPDDLEKIKSWVNSGALDN